MGNLVKEIVKKTTYKYDEKGNVIEKIEEVTEKHFKEDNHVYFPGPDIIKAPGKRNPWTIDDGIMYLKHAPTSNMFGHGPVTRYDEKGIPTMVMENEL